MSLLLLFLGSSPYISPPGSLPPEEFSALGARGFRSSVSGHSHALRGSGGVAGYSGRGTVERFSATVKKENL